MSIYTLTFDILDRVSNVSVPDSKQCFSMFCTYITKHTVNIINISQFEDYVYKTKGKSERKNMKNINQIVVTMK